MSRTDDTSPSTNPGYRLKREPLYFGEVSGPLFLVAGAGLATAAW